jgi:NAD(P)-dependent dehydrogenase (short-subunit alcohol dehydrogenase family)
MSGQLDGHVALVTGGTRGLGRAIADALRPNTFDEVASVAVLLASPSMASITGCLFPVDGGTMPY